MRTHASPALPPPDTDLGSPLPIATGAQAAAMPRVLLAVLMLALAARVVHVDFPVAGWHAWRQADTAAMARNYYENGFRLLYPQVDWGGGSPGYVESEFPVYSYAVALLYAAFGPRDLWGRLLSIACALATIAVLYRLVRARVSERAAGWAALVYALAPLDVYYGRAFMPESAMLLGAVLGVHGFSQWIDRGRRRDLALAWLGITLAVLIKPPNLCLGLPLLFLAWTRNGAACLRDARLWGFAALVLAPVAAWYAHAHGLLAAGGVSFNIWGFGTDKWGNFDLLASPGFYHDVFLKSIAERHLTWSGFVLFGIGLALPRRRRDERLFDVWLAAAVISILIVARGNRVHEYYQLPFMLPASVFAGKALARFLPLERAAWRPHPVRVAAFAALLAAFCLLGVLRYERFMAREDRNSSLFHLGDAVQRLTSRSDRVVAVNEGNPAVLYRCDRKGWNSAPEDLEDDFLRARSRDGARYLVGEKSLFRGEARKQRLEVLLAAWPVVEDDPDYFVVRLSERAADASRAGEGARPQDPRSPEGRGSGSATARSDPRSSQEGDASP